MRNTPIDIAKGLGILTVVFCHNYVLCTNNSEISRVIFSFHMPLFFFISGMFFKPQISFKEMVKSKTHSLLKPYAVTATLMICYMYIYGLRHPSDINYSNEMIKILYGSSPTLAWVQLWFLTHLFTIFIFAWILERHWLSNIKSFWGYSIALAIMFAMGIITIKSFWEIPVDPFSLNHIIFESPFGLDPKTYNGKPMLSGLPFNLDLLLVTTPIFLSGYLLSEKLKNFEFSYKWLLFFLFIFAALHIQYDSSMGLHKRSYDHLFITTAQMISGIYLTFSISHLLSQIIILKDILAYIGKASLFILLFHFTIQHQITGSTQYYFPHHSYAAAYLGFIVSIVMSLGIYAVVNKVHWLQATFSYLPNKK